ncbi:MAG: hypothetical protein L6R40_000976 [Gallowayella cf. fulva]|nr:MAG: hypothetical protein L6R40_000976 [Xanthomendoza cf. fulva]
MSAAANRMAAKVAESATKAVGAAGAAGKAARAGASGEGKKGKETVLQKGAKRDPELYILLTIMTGAFGLAGFHFGTRNATSSGYPASGIILILLSLSPTGRKPTSSSSEASVSMAEGTMPWQTSSAKGGDEHFKYQYHPGGDKTKAPKDAPSALNSVIIPNVTLPKKTHDQFNKWGKEGYP